MPSFHALPLRGGHGAVHVNRFRIAIRPTPNIRLPTGEELMLAMPDLMDSRTAIVRVDRGRRWRGQPTLVFTGRAILADLLGPFELRLTTADAERVLREIKAAARRIAQTLPAPQRFVLERLIDLAPDSFRLALVIPLPLPRSWRDWLVPEVHTDTVGAAAIDAHAFTAETLKRHDDDQFEARVRRTVANIVPVAREAMEGAIKAALGPLANLPYVDDAIDAVLRAATAPLEAFMRQLVHDQIVAPIIDINQHHFLAGRRAFKMGTRADFGLEGQGWIFETAAVERYSLPIFAFATDRMMGGATGTIIPVWNQMVTKVAAHYGQPTGGRLPTPESAYQSTTRAGRGALALYQNIVRLHPALVQP